MLHSLQSSNSSWQEAFIRIGSACVSCLPPLLRAVGPGACSSLPTLWACLGALSVLDLSPIPKGFDLVHVNSFCAFVFFRHLDSPSYRFLLVTDQRKAPRLFRGFPSVARITTMGALSLRCLARIAVPRTLLREACEKLMQGMGL